MPRRPGNQPRTDRSRDLRLRQTKAESLVWTVVRAKRLAGLRFRRQHPVGPFFADFACVEKRVIVEIDGGYHELRDEVDQNRQAYLESAGWRVIRFRNEDVLDDVEAVAVSLSRQLRVDSEDGGKRV